MILLSKTLPVPTNTADIIGDLLSYLLPVLALAYFIYLLVKNRHSIFASRVCPNCGKKLKANWRPAEPRNKISQYRMGRKRIIPGLKHFHPVLCCRSCGYEMRG